DEDWDGFVRTSANACAAGGSGCVLASVADENFEAGGDCREATAPCAELLLEEFGLLSGKKLLTCPFRRFARLEYLATIQHLYGCCLARRSLGAQTPAGAA